MGVEMAREFSPKSVIMETSLMEMDAISFATLKKITHVMKMKLGLQSAINVVTQQSKIGQRNAMTATQMTMMDAVPLAKSKPTGSVMVLSQVPATLFALMEQPSRVLSHVTMATQITTTVVMIHVRSRQAGNAQLLSPMVYQLAILSAEMAW